MPQDLQCPKVNNASRSAMPQDQQCLKICNVSRSAMPCTMFLLVLGPLESCARAANEPFRFSAKRMSMLRCMSDLPRLKLSTINCRFPIARVHETNSKISKKRTKNKQTIPNVPSPRWKGSEDETRGQPTFVGRKGVRAKPSADTETCFPGDPGWPGRTRRTNHARSAANTQLCCFLLFFRTRRRLRAHGASS